MVPAACKPRPHLVEVAPQMGLENFWYWPALHALGLSVLRGEYELSGGRLSIVRPEDEKMTGLVWRVRNRNLLELVEHPVSSQFGSDYRGAILVRRIDEERARGNEG